MPYKAWLKENLGERKKEKKPRTTNWTEYTSALKKRGSLTLWVSEDIHEIWQANPPSIKKRGHPQEYLEEAITIVLTLGIIFKQRLRQTEGFVDSLFKLMKIELPVPDFTSLSRRGRSVLKIRKLESMAEPGHIIIDSTGVKIFEESEWLETKHGKQYNRKVWRKLHLGINEGKYFVSRVLTNHITDDRACLDDLLQQADPTKVTEVIADTGYDGEETYRKLNDYGIQTVIPPPITAQVSNKDLPSKRDETIAYIAEKGKYAWQTKNQYGRRAHIENGIGRYKTIIGRKLHARTWDNQNAETHLGCFIINKFTSLGMPISVKIS